MRINFLKDVIEAVAEYGYTRTRKSTSEMNTMCKFKKQSKKNRFILSIQYTRYGYFVICRLNTKEIVLFSTEPIKTIRSTVEEMERRLLYPE